MDYQDLLKPLICSRMMQLFYHHCHNLTSGEAFFSDHLAFGEYYDRLEEDYDRIAEYMIAVFGVEKFDTIEINSFVVEKLNLYRLENMSIEGMFKIALELEKEYYLMLMMLDSVGTIGIKNMVGDLAEASDVRVYKIQQRIK